MRTANVRKIGVAAVALMCAASLTLFVAIIFGGGTLGVVAEGDCVVEKVETQINSSDSFEAHITFSVSAATEQVDNLQDQAEYKNKVFINGKPLESYSGCYMQFFEKEGKYILKLALNRNALDWTIPDNNAANMKRFFANEIVIKEEFALKDESNSVLESDEYIYTGQDKFIKGYREFYNSAPEATIKNVVFVENGDPGKYRLTVSFDKPMFDAEKQLNHVMRRNMSTVNLVNNIPAELLKTGEEGNSVADFAVKTGIRYSIGKLVKINGMLVSDWLDLPLKSAYKAGVTDDADIAKFIQAVGDYDGMCDVHVQGNDIIFNLLKNGSKTFELESGEKTVEWNAPDMSGDIKVEILAGFGGKQMKISQGAQFVYGASTSELDENFEELKIAKVFAPVYTDGVENFTISLQFDQTISSGEHPYYSWAKAQIASIPGVQDKYSATEFELCEKYDLFRRAQNNIVIGGKFGDSDEFKELSIGEMMKALPMSTAPNAGVMHLDDGDTARVIIGGTYTAGSEVKDWPYHVRSLEQNFTLTVKAGFRTLTGFEVKEDLNFVFDPVTAQWYEGRSVDDINATVVSSVINAIDSLPAADSITLAHKTAVSQVRAAYDALSAERKELVTNYEKLTAAENKIAELEEANNNGNGDDNDGNEKEPEKEGGCGSSLGAVSVTLALIMLIAAAFITVLKLRRRE